MEPALTTARATQDIHTGTCIGILQYRVVLASFYRYVLWTSYIGTRVELLGTSYVHAVELAATRYSFVLESTCSICYLVVQS